MGSVCAENQHHKFHQLYLTKKSLREIDIPPRKLLGRRSDNMFLLDSPKTAEDHAVFSKFLPYNSLDDDDSDPYSSDHFRMYEFKVRKCNRSRSHDWTDCPFAHPGEKARRRDPRRFHYSGTVCSEFRKGSCAKGDNCEFSHGVFECWLHPDRYRTEACKDGKNCKRKVCFFAHSSRQLRFLPDTSSPDPPMNSHSPTAAMEKKYHHPNFNHHCCVFCHSSPTSTLMGMSRVSPPGSPPFGDRFSGGVESVVPEFNKGGMSYKDALNELMSSLEAMNVNREARGIINPPWVDVNFNSVDEQPQFVMSPSPRPTPGTSKFATGESKSKFFRGEFSGRNLMEEGRFNNSNNESSSGSGPDIGWVNDLLT